MAIRGRPIVEPVSPSKHKYNQMRGIVSPCAGCKNNIPVNDGEIEDIEHNIGPVCPKRKLYKQWQKYQHADKMAKWEGPVYNLKLLSQNPVWPALKEHDNSYAYVFIATYEDNVDTKWNPNFDTERIHCRGPYLIRGSEKSWHIIGHLEQSDRVIVTEKNFMVDGQSFLGFVEEAQIWQVARGYLREIDRNILKSNSASGVV